MAKQINAINKPTGPLNKMRKSVHSPALPAEAGAAACPPSPEWGLYRPDGQRKYLTPGEFSRFVDAATRAPSPVMTFCLMLAYSGCRISEVLAMRGCDIEQEGGFVAVRCLKKRGRQVVRLVPLPPALIVALATGQLSGDTSRRLWPWSRTWGWMLVRRIMAQARLAHPSASPKGLRHAFGVRAVLSGIPLPLVQKWLGHADIATTAIYTNVMGSEERQLAERMWAALKH